MKKLTKTIACAAATAATTALVATTVAIETATAAIFTLEEDWGKITIEYDGSMADFTSSTDADWTGVGVELADGSEWIGVWEEQYSDWVGYVYKEGENEGETVWVWKDSSEEGVVGSVSLSVEWEQPTEFSPTSFDIQAVDAAAAEAEAESAGFPGRGGAQEEGARVSTPEPSAAIALGVLGLGAVASRLRRRSK